MTQSIYQPLDDSRRLPWPEAMGKATIRARFMLAYADTDADTLPDAHAPRGTVTLIYAGSGYRWTDADGSRLVAALPVVCPILPDGTLGSPDYNLEGDGRVIIMPTEVAGLEPVGSTVTATIRIANAQATFTPITFTVKPDDDINLAELVSVQATPGVVTVVDDTIAVRAEAAANRAEDAASEAGDALTQITAATDTVQTLSGTIAATADEVSLLQASAAGSASIAETAATEALTTLAGKVTGAGMSIRLDTSVGTRVFLDHPGDTTMLYGDTGWRDMSSYLPLGVNGMFYARRTLYATDVKLNVALTADSTLIGGRKSLVADLMRGLPRNMFPSDAYYVAPLIMREGGSGAPTGTAILNYQSQTETRLRITSSSPGDWTVGDTIRISGTIPNNQPWPTSHYGTP